MLDKAGEIKIICKDTDKARVKTLLIENMASLYAKSSCIEYKKGAIDEASNKVRVVVEKEICVVSETDDGLKADILDIQSGCFSLADEILGENSYTDEYGISEETTYRYALSELVKAYPEITLEGNITISSHYTPSVFARYHAKNGVLVETYCLLCTCCGKLFTPEEGFWFEEGDEEILDVEGAIGICSRECAQNLIADPDLDDYGIIEDYEDEIKEKLETEG